MSCCYTCLVERSRVAWDDLAAGASMSIPLGFDLDLAQATGGCVVVAVHSISVSSFDAARAQLVGKTVVRGCDADDSEDFTGPEIFRIELGQAIAGDAIAIALPFELASIGRVFLDVIQGIIVSAQSIELSVWLRSNGEHP